MVSGTFVCVSANFFVYRNFRNLMVSGTLYTLAVSKTQKVVLSAFGIGVEQVKYKANYISENLRVKWRLPGDRHQ